MNIDKPYNYIGNDPKLRAKAEELAKQVYNEGIENTDFGTLFDQFDQKESEDINLAKLQDLDDITVGEKEGFVFSNDVDAKEIIIEFYDGEMKSYSYDELNKLINKSSTPSAELGNSTPMGKRNDYYYRVIKEGDKYYGLVGKDTTTMNRDDKGRNGFIPYVLLDFGDGQTASAYFKYDVATSKYDAFKGQLDSLRGFINPNDARLEDWERSPLEFDDKGEIIFKPNTSEAEKKRIKAEFEKDLKDMGKMRYDNGGALDKEFKFDKNFIVYVPSTTNVGSKIHPTEMDVRVNSVGEFVADKFGGFTKTETDGGYKSIDGDIIEEDIVKVSVFAKGFDWSKHEQEVIDKVKEWAKKWGQEAIGFEYEGNLYYIDEEGKYVDGGEIAESLPYTATFANGGKIKSSKDEDGNWSGTYRYVTFTLYHMTNDLSKAKYWSYSYKLYSPLMLREETFFSDSDDDLPPIATKKQTLEELKRSIDNRIEEFESVQKRQLKHIAKADILKKGGEIKVGDWVSNKKGDAYGRGQVYKIDALGVYLKDKYENESNKAFQVRNLKHKGKPRYEAGGKLDMIEINEDGSNVPAKLMEVFSEFNDDGDGYLEMERLKLKAKAIGYHFDYGLDGTPTEFCEISEMAKGGEISDYFQGGLSFLNY